MYDYWNDDYFVDDWCDWCGTQLLNWEYVYCTRQSCIDDHNYHLDWKYG